jgi:hypothetical protein
MNNNTSICNKGPVYFFVRRILPVIFGFLTLSPYCYSQQKVYETPGIRDDLPVFYKNLAERQVYQLSWLHGDRDDFSSWKAEARAKVMECLLTPPPAVPFNPVVISEQDRGSYVARKIVFNVTADSRVLAFMLIPKSPGPHPAVLLLHDHGGKYDIGKEKVIEPWDEPVEKIESAKKWVKDYYGGRFIGDKLVTTLYHAPHEFNLRMQADAFEWLDNLLKNTK